MSRKLGEEVVEGIAPGENVQLSSATGIRPAFSQAQPHGLLTSRRWRRVRWWRADLLAFSFVTLIVLGVLIMGVVLLARDVARETNLNQMRADLVSGVSHELKAPLSVIRVYAETIDDVSDATLQERRHFAQAIVQETDRLRRLIDDVVDFSRIQQGERCTASPSDRCQTWSGGLSSSFDATRTSWIHGLDGDRRGAAVGRVRCTVR